MPQSNETRAEAASEKLSLLVRLRAAPAVVRHLPSWVKSHRLIAAAAGGGVLLAISLTVALWIISTRGDEEAKLPPAELLRRAFVAFDSGDRETASRLAEKVRGAEELEIGQLGGPPFILGMLAGEEADQGYGKGNTTRRLLAASLLEEARDRGFPPGREAEGAYALGRQLYLAGRIADSRLPLEEAIAAKHPRSSEIHRLLAEVNLRDATPRLDEALAHISKRLEDARLSEEDRQAALLERSRIQLLRGDLAGSRETIAQIPAGSAVRSEMAIVRAMRIMREADELRPAGAAEDAPLPDAAAEKYRQAIAVLREATEHDTLRNQSTPKAMYLVGLCYARLDDTRAALAQFQGVMNRFPGGAEAAAAEFQVAGLLQKSAQTEEAIAVYRRALAGIGKAHGEGNPWLPTAQLRTRCQSAYEDFLNERQFAAAVELAKLAEELFTPLRTLQLEARAHQEWGRLLSDQAAAAAPGDAPALREQAYAAFRHAGRVYVRLSKLRVTNRDYPDDLWSGAESYLAGHDYKSAVKVLNEYLKVELRRRRPLALVALGEALLAQDKPDEALAVLRRAINDHPRDAASFKARLLASTGNLVQGKAAQAEAMLLENLSDGLLTPASQEWRDSLFALGRLLYRAGRYDDAIQRLDEAVARYPDYVQSLEARYLLAAAHAHAAHLAHQGGAASAAAGQQLAHGQRVGRSWQAALAGYDKLIQEITKRQDEKPLSTEEKAMLRNGYFGRGEALFALSRYDQAIKAYSDIVNRYQNQPEVLDAYLQLSECYRRLHQPHEARGALEQAKIVLAQLKDDAPFTEVTNYRRDEWTNLLDALTTN